MTTNTASAIFAGITPCSLAFCIVNSLQFSFQHIQHLLLRCHRHISCCAAIVMLCCHRRAMPSPSLRSCRCRPLFNPIWRVRCTCTNELLRDCSPRASPREPRMTPRRVPPRAVPPRLLASCGQQWCIRTECDSISHLNCYHFSSSYCDSQPSPYLNHHVDHIVTAA